MLLNSQNQAVSVPKGIHQEALAAYIEKKIPSESFEISGFFKISERVRWITCTQKVSGFKNHF